MAPEGNAGTRKMQSSIEYISTFAIALLILVVVIAVVAYLMYSNSNSTQTPSSCTITAQINCVQIAVASNGKTVQAVVEFTNNLFQRMDFQSANAISFSPGASGSYQGTCIPANAPLGATVICNATLSGYSAPLGSQLNPDFVLHYSECANNSCIPYNTVGTGTVYVSGSLPIYPVTLLSNVAGGQISVDGVAYASNSVVDFINGAEYYIYADAPSGYTFSSWTQQGGVTVQSGTSQLTTGSATSNGILTADFH